MADNLTTIAKNLSYLSQPSGKGVKKTGGRVVFKSADEAWGAKHLQGLSKGQIEQIRAGATMLKASVPAGTVIFAQSRSVEKSDHYGFFAPSPYSMARDLAAGSLRMLLDEKITSFEVDYIGKVEDEFVGLVVGAEMIFYSFAELWPVDKRQGLSLSFKSTFKNQEALVKKGRALGAAVNLGRFLVDLPGNALNPKSYVELAKGIFAKGPVKVSVWDEARLKKEKMNLHVAVGQGAEFGPCMIHLSYRHGKVKGAPIAFVGKGITFDSGGLDIKPASGMRLMKKDMGGSASIMGLAYWVMQTQPMLNCDFYLAIAENATGSKSFRPGDIFTAKNGLTVEIHNTDAEGRLVLADVLTAALVNKPKMIIDVATLTGAIKYGLGSSVPGLFSNDDHLAELLLRAAQFRGEPAWRMPLVPEERGRLKSEVADMVNCADGFGGAVTAALFLEKFVDKVPWAHFDIYSWNDRGKGPYRFSGGNGQLIQALSEFISMQQA